MIIFQVKWYIIFNLDFINSESDHLSNFFLVFSYHELSFLWSCRNHDIFLNNLLKLSFTLKIFPICTLYLLKNAFFSLTFFDGCLLFFYGYLGFSSKPIFFSFKISSIASKLTKSSSLQKFDRYLSLFFLCLNFLGSFLLIHMEFILVYAIRKFFSPHLFKVILS